MINKKNLLSVAWPACVLFLVSLTVSFIQSPPDVSTWYFLLASLIGALTSNILWQIFAYLSCWTLVLRKGKPQNYVWVNYIVWTVIANYVNVMNILGIQ